MTHMPQHSIRCIECAYMEEKLVLLVFVGEVCRFDIGYVAADSVCHDSEKIGIAT